jgi:hypothetical protein
MKKITIVLLTLVYALCLAVPALTSVIAAEIKEYPLFAGKSTKVGKIQVTNDSENIKVKVFVDDPWVLAGSPRMEVATTVEGIPQKNGNPIPGQFTYSGKEVSMPLGGQTSGKELILAVHANVKKRTGYNPPSLADFANALPSQTKMTISYPGTSSYFKATFSAGLSGTFNSWCIDTDHGIAPNTPYTVDVYSSYETLPAGTVAYPENLDLANWVVNQKFMGKASACNGAYTWGDVQVALWTLLESTVPTSATGTVGAWEQCRVNEIVNAAKSKGENYIPPCGGVIAIVLVPTDGKSQVTFAETTAAAVGVECVPVYGSEETAWAAESEGNHAFTGKNWATYVHYTIQ